MKPVRILTCLLVLGALAVVSFGANNIQSNFVPGDFGPAAEKLGIQQTNGYYNLGAMLSAAIRRIEDLEALVTQHASELGEVRRALEALEARGDDTGADGAACAECLARLNSATREEFMQVSGIGSVKSAALDAAQPFSVATCSTDAIRGALDAVPGIGLKLRESIVRHFCPELAH